MGAFRSEYVDSKHFTVLPHYLEDFLFRRFSSSTTVWVFKIFYRQAQMRDDWCAEIPVRILVKVTGRAESSINRAIQQLADAGLIKRHLAKKASDPREEAVAITELLCPPDLKAAFEQAPNRRSKARADEQAPTSTDTVGVDNTPSSQPAQSSSPPSRETRPGDTPSKPTSLSERLQQQQRIEANLSEFDTRLYAQAYRTQNPDLLNRITSVTTDEIAILASGIPTKRVGVANTPNEAREDRRPHKSNPQRRLSQPHPVDVIKTRELTQRLAGDGESALTLANEVIWAAIHGCLASKPFKHARNIAAKLIKEGRWERPWGMPGDWAYAGRNSTILDISGMGG